MSVINENDVLWEENTRGQRFAAKRKRLGLAAGSEKLGCSLYEVAPGKSAFPYHLHYANEEAIYILQGEGSLRTPEGERRVGEGDYVSLLTGARGTHELINRSQDVLRYLCVSTMYTPEVAEYPDSGKLGVYAGAAPKPGEEDTRLFKFYPDDVDVDYWHGED